MIGVLDQRERISSIAETIALVGAVMRPRRSDQKRARQIAGPKDECPDKGKSIIFSLTRRMRKKV
jgi:hypothetical protein